MAASFIVPPVAVFSGPGIYWRLPLLQSLALLFPGIFYLGLAYWFWFEGLDRKPAGEVGVFLYLEQLSTMLAAPFFLEESITLPPLAGAVLVILGIWLVQIRGHMQIGKNPA